MANKLYDETSIQAIATAIRGKNGSSDSYTVGQMAQAITNIPSGGGGFQDRLVAGIKRNCRIRNLTLTQWSTHMYELASGNYYLAYANVPMVIYLRFGFERLANNTVVGKITEFNYRNTVNNGVLVFPNSWEGTPTTMMNTGIPEDENVDSDDFNWSNNNLTITSSGNAYTNTSPVLFQPSKISNIDTVNSHPYAVSLLGGSSSATIANYMDGTTPIEVDDILTCTTADVPSGFDLSTIDKGYFLYTTNNCCILIVGDSNYDGLFVNSNDKLDSSSGTTIYCSPSWNSLQPSQTNALYHITLGARTNRPPFCEGNNDNYYTNVMYNTQDILDLDNNVIVPANITIADFKSKFFNLT